MNFRFAQVSGPNMAAVTFLFLWSFLVTANARAQNDSRPVAETPNWKDQQEYDLFQKMSQTADLLTFAQYSVTKATVGTGAKRLG